MGIVLSYIRHCLCSFFVTPVSVGNVVRQILGKRNYAKVSRNLEHPAFIIRAAAAMLGMHEDELIVKVAHFGGWRTILSLPRQTFSAHQINWQFCMENFCIPLQKNNRYLGIACCNPDLICSYLSEECEGQLYLISIEQFYAYFEQVKEQVQNELFPESRDPLASKLIYIVDDRHEFLEVASALIESLNAEVRAFSDPECLLLSLQACGRVPDLIISDINMPRYSGFELVRVLRSQGILPGKIILTSSEESIAINSIVQQMGVAGFISKRHGPAFFSEYLRQALLGYVIAND